MRYEYRLELARGKLNRVMDIVKRDQSIEYLERFLMGKGATAISIRDQRGWLVNDYDAVLQAIYSYYKTNPEDHIDHLTENALIDIFKATPHNAKIAQM